MTIDRRLHHAARELREVRVDVPPLCDVPLRGSARHGGGWSRLAALAAPMLFVAGGLLAVGVMQREVSEPARSDIPAGPAVVDDEVATTGRVGASVTAPSVREELRMIAEILGEPPRTPAPTVDAPDPGVTPPAAAGPN